MSDSHLPCRAHAIPDHAILLKATAQHGRRERAYGLTARFRLLPAITRSSTKLLSDAYQSQMHVASVKPNTVCHGRGKSGSSTLQKKTICYPVLIFPATMRTFTKDTTLSEQGGGAAWLVWINSTGWARHGNGMLCVNRPLVYLMTFLSTWPSSDNTQCCKIWRWNYQHKLLLKEMISHFYVESKKSREKLIL